MKRLETTTKNALRQVRHARIRTHLSGTATKPRISVFRSLKGMTVQLIDDEAKKTICFASTKSLKSGKVEGKTAKVAAAFAAGQKIAELAKAKGIKEAIFDRAGYEYHGRVAAVAEGARAGGLQF